MTTNPLDNNTGFQKPQPVWELANDDTNLVETSGSAKGGEKDQWIDRIVAAAGNGAVGSVMKNPNDTWPVHEDIFYGERIEMASGLTEPGGFGVR